MPRASPIKKAMKDYLEHCYQRGLTEETIRSYENTIKRVERVLLAENRNTNPKTFGPKELGTMIRAYRGKPDTIRKYKIFLKFNNNHIPFPKIPTPTPRRTWLTEEDEELLRASDMRPIEKIAIHLGLDYGFRRIEMVRAKLIHFQGRYITIVGKGTFGGKRRYLKLTDYMKWILNDYLPERQNLIHQATNTDDHLLIYLKGKEVHPYTPEGITGVLWRLSRKLQIPFSSHTLRRTFARSVRAITDKEGKPTELEAIRDILGHTKIDETEKYIGSNIDQMDTALVEYHQRCSQKTTIQMKLK